jgi:hypothetical protein
MITKDTRPIETTAEVPVIVDTKEIASNIQLISAKNKTQETVKEVRATAATRASTSNENEEEKSIEKRRTDKTIAVE